ncbi:hypothetical protein [Christensenella tenuis]|uniref:Uncharacterized protein n=1 Tax=Christensenella tenuis TaxID=2763033 RepID=A0ABR7EEZ6_9FIRM|nr:hypothetical protein [Christensenella tenuis]MBC5648347.1 hypothetical protein [Christensenella tenuis]
MEDHSGLPASGGLCMARTGERALGNRPRFGSGERAAAGAGKRAGCGVRGEGIAGTALYCRRKAHGLK